MELRCYYYIKCTFSTPNIPSKPEIHLPKIHFQYLEYIIRSPFITNSATHPIHFLLADQKCHLLWFQVFWKPWKKMCNTFSMQKPCQITKMSEEWIRNHGYFFWMTNLYLFGRHLRFVALCDVSKSVASDGPDAKTRHDDGEILSGLYEFAEDFRIASQRPVAFQGRPKCQWWGEVAKEKVRASQGQNKRISRVDSKFPRREHRVEEDRIQSRAQNHDRKIQAQEKVVRWVG